MSLESAIAEFDVSMWASRHGGKADGKDQRVMLIDCPYCWKRLHLWISKVSKRWACFVCGAGDGDGKNIIGLIKDVDQVGFQDALAILETNQAHVPIDSIKVLRKGIRRNVETKRNEPDGYDEKFWEEAPFDPKVVPYPDTFQALGPGGNAYTRQRGIPHGAASWYRMGECSGGWLRGRLIFTVYHQGQLIYWIARDMTGRSKKKILNLPSKKTGAVGSKEVLLNLDRAVTVNGGRIVLTEGPVSAAVTGPDAVASFGKSLSRHQVRRMIEAGVTHVVVAWDGDAKAEALEVARWLTQFFKVSYVEFPVDKDPADLGHEVTREYIARARPIVEADVMDIPELI